MTARYVRKRNGLSRQRASAVTESQKYCSSGIYSTVYGCLGGMFDVDSMLPDNLAFDGPSETGGANGSDF